MLPGGETGAFRSIWRLVRTTPSAATGMDPFAAGFSVRRALEPFREAGGPTAVLMTYPIALQLLRACREQHIAVPPLSAINVDMAAFGLAAGNLVLEWLAGTAPARTTLVPVSNWVDRATTGPPRGS